jgi:hypothetical protein
MNWGSTGFVGRLAWRGLAGLALLALPAIAAGAGLTPAPASPSVTLPGVTVTAKPPGPPVPTLAQRNFVKSHGAPSRIGQMTRWRRSICPTTVGLSPAMNDFVSQRVKAVAAEVGAPVGPCKTDVEIIFSAEPQKLLDSIRAKAPVLLGFHYPAQARQLATVRYPIQAWYVTATQGGTAAGGRGGLGTGLLAGALGAAEGGTAVGGVLDDGCCGTPGGCAGDHFSDCLSNQIAAVVVVADSRQVADRPIGAIADYISMLVLTKVDLASGCSELPSIVNLLSARCAADDRPTAMTSDDIAYLKALYRIEMARYLWVQRDSIADMMASGAASK